MVGVLSQKMFSLIEGETLVCGTPIFIRRNDKGIAGKAGYLRLTNTRLVVCAFSNIYFQHYLRGMADEPRRLFLEFAPADVRSATPGKYALAVKITLDTASGGVWGLIFPKDFDVEAVARQIEAFRDSPVA